MSLFVGAISGTSIDGLDLALLQVNDDLTILHTTTVEFPQDLRVDIKALTQPGENEIYRMGRAHVGLGRFTAKAILEFLEREAIPPEAITAIGSHGQTIRHHPESDPPFTLQIGDGSSIAEGTQITTICDFRSRDVAAGGGGAPLVPIFHNALFGQSSDSTIILNIGGISNISILPSMSRDTLTGYDTGPGNALLDAWIEECKQVPYDIGGLWSQTGEIDRQLLEAFLGHSYFSLEPPKSTGKELFNLQFIREHLSKVPCDIQENIQATLLELTCQSIVDEVNRYDPDRLIVCGGGRLNPHLMQRLRGLLHSSCALLTTDDLGVDGDGIEAATFAYLAYCLTVGRTANVPAVTGAMGDRLLGCVYPASDVNWT